MARVLKLVNGVPRMQSISIDPDTIYDETVDVGTDITTGTPITLPNSGVYQGDDLIVMLNGQDLQYVFDYTYVGSGPDYTQIAVTFDLEEGDRLRFRIEDI